MLALVVLPATLAACGGDASALDPAGPAARSIAELWWAMLAGATLLFLLVMGLFALTMLKPGLGSNVSTGTWIVAGGLVMPIPVLAVLVNYALFQGERLIHMPGAEGEPLRIEAHARRWQWEFRYPDMPGAAPTIDVLHIPVGQPVEIVATSEDVIHSFWVPRLGGKIDAIPGHATTLRLIADIEGTFGGLCSEFCGLGHPGMRFRVEAHPPAAFRAALGAEGAQ